jgi:uroporphyrinogen-III synthase
MAAKSAIEDVPSVKIKDAPLLNDIRVVVTRPEPQATKTAKALIAAGAEAIAMPMLNIKAIHSKTVAAQYKTLFEAIAEPTKVIYVSAPAAHFGMSVLKRLPKFLPLARHFAIGAATAAKLTEMGVHSIYVPTQGEDSEALLAEPILQKIKGQTIIIMKGASDAGGRTLLAETLLARGAMVVGVACYRREHVTLKRYGRAAFRWAVNNATHVLAGSVETLDAIQHNGNRDICGEIPHLLVPHRRIADVAKKRGIKKVSVVSLDDNKLIESLAHFID